MCFTLDITMSDIFSPTFENVAKALDQKVKDL